MIVDLNSFGREYEIDTRLASADIDLDEPNARVSSDVDITGRLTKLSHSIGLSGKLATTLEIDCDRCLEPQKVPVNIDFDLEFVGSTDFARDANLEVVSDDLKIDLADGEIDLAEIAREQILLDLPQQFFCSDDCQGLCLKCGANLNLKDCNCIEEEIDPRWAALKNLN